MPEKVTTNTVYVLRGISSGYPDPSNSCHFSYVVGGQKMAYTITQAKQFFDADAAKRYRDKYASIYHQFEAVPVTITYRENEPA